MSILFRYRIRSLREERGISQAQLARIAQVNQSSVANWENGKATPRYSVLLKIANYFKVSLDYLAGRSDVREVLTSETVGFKTSEHERAIVESYRKLTPREQSMVCKQLDVQPPVRR